MVSNLIFLAAFLISVALLLVCVLTIKALRKRDNRRSPLHGKKIANLPGQQLMTRITDHGDNLILAVMMMYFALPVILGLWALHRVDWSTVKFGFNEGLFLAGGLVAFGYGLATYYRNYSAYMQAKEGQLAEQITGQLLNRLVGPQCIVAHDMPCDGFNIDHIVIGPRAVYAVETKSIRKPQGSDDDSHYKVTFDGTALSFPDFQNRKAVEQARRQAHWLRRYLKESLDLDIPVVPAIALPGWWIDKTESGRNSDVKVFTPMGRGAEFLATGEEIIGASLRSLIAQAIAQRYPSVDD